MAEAPEQAGKPEKPAKGGKGGKGKEQAQKVVSKKEGIGADNPDFKYIVRIANTDLDGKQFVEIALSNVKGLGFRTAGVIAEQSGVDRYERIGNLSDAQVDALETAVKGLSEHVPVWMINRSKDVDSGKHLHLVSTDVELRLRDDLNRLKKIRSRRGIRHETGQKVRGQRSRSNGRTGLAMGVVKKKQQQGGGS